LTDPQLAAYLKHHGGVKLSPATLTTDDWPYFYQHEPGLPMSVIVISVALMLLCWTLLRDTGVATRRCGGISFSWARRERSIEKIIAENPRVPALEDDRPINEYFKLRSWFHYYR
jgi:hypothetical protein